MRGRIRESSHLLAFFLGSVILVTLSTCVRIVDMWRPCMDERCSGHGTCEVTRSGEPICACDPGYRNTSPLACEYDSIDANMPIVDAADLDGSVGSESRVDAGARDSSSPADALVETDSAGLDGGEDAGTADAANAAGGPDVASSPDAQAEDSALVDSGAIYTTGTWVHIPGGTFEMGCSANDPDCNLDEEPSHTVVVDTFSMLQTEVTQAQYLAVMGINPSYFSQCGPNCPVENVDWLAAKTYCEAIGGRLPSEAEWEYASRAGTTTAFSCGSTSACIGAVAWFFENADTGDGRQTHPVATKRVNAFGLYDMDGNVWEWIEDCWHDDYTNAPSTGGVWAGGDCAYRLKRGCGWMNGRRYMRVSYRQKERPARASNEVGMRCARDVM